MFAMCQCGSPLIPFHQAFKDNLAAIHDYKEDQKFNEATKNAAAKSYKVHRFPVVPCECSNMLEFHV